MENVVAKIGAVFYVYDRHFMPTAAYYHCDSRIANRFLTANGDDLTGSFLPSSTLGP